ncbi:MAG TPA: hypothetical protein VJT13_06785 [Xanthobacteraceae bacterium]|nr:hypothetical protein [Xanthobacteraceae bacterium]
MRSSVVLAFAGLSLLATAAAAGDLDSAVLRGSRAYEATPSYQIGPAAPSYEYAPPPGAAVMAPVPAAPGYAFEVGARYWYSSGRLAKDLYDDPRFSNDIVSRLTYDGLASHSFEAFGKIALPNSLFVKGYAGISGLQKGSLNDEDFPPLTLPYSSTMSSQSGGRLGYLTADLGYGFAVNPATNVSLFAGYAFVAEKVNAYGCNQIGSNPFICVPVIGAGVLAITEDAQWHAARLGLGLEFKPIEKLTLSMEAAWLPFVQLRSHDTHWLRLGSTFGSFAGPIPQTGDGTGFQLEALLSYQVWDCFSLGLGGRYWRFDARGFGDLEATIVGATNPVPQPMEFVSERYGVFLQGSYKFNL